ncbi:uncharacterized protein LOC142338387 [Convolutriloba macropyga]|uniref:uncharacterized protein LOC142338387 n=1 Tax=Convolutriloba macropyga TaxID=536237 RepID=UPI003F526F33
MRILFLISFVFVVCSYIAQAQNGELTEQQKKEALDSQNVFRNDLGWKDRKGQYFSGYPLNMKKLKWDDDLERSAQETADKCKKNHLPYDDPLSKALEERFGSMGENLYGIGGFKKNRNVGYDFVKKWYAEIKYYEWYKQNCLSGKVCTHLTQLLWHDTEYVGCAQQKCVSHYKKKNKKKTWTNFVCRYGPAGNFNYEAPFDMTNTYDRAQICGNDGMVPDTELPNLCV